MGGNGSKQREEEARRRRAQQEAEERERERQRQWRLEEERREEERRREAYRAQQRREREERESREVDDALRSNQIAIDMQMQMLRDMRNEHFQNFQALKRQAETEGKRVTDRMEAEAKIELEKREKEQKAEMDKLEKQRNVLDQARAALRATMDKGRTDRTQLQSDHQTKTDQQRKEHADYVEAATADLNSFIVRKNAAIKKAIEEGAAEQDAIMERKFQLESAAIAGRQKLMALKQTEDAHDAFRREAGKLRMEFKSFEEAYQTQEPALSKIARQMRRKKTLTDLPQSDIVYNALNDFIKVIEDFGIPEAFREQFEDNYTEIGEGIEEIESAFDEIEFWVGEYLEKTQPEDLENCYESMKINFDLVKTTLAHLSSLLSEFEIPLSNHMMIEINRQQNLLEIAAAEPLAIGAKKQLEIE